MATLKDIAEETGLAIGTVSRILRNRERVADDTRARVLEVAERLKYRPNLLVRGIQSGRTQTIGVILRPVDDFRATLLSGINDALIEEQNVAMVVSRVQGAAKPTQLDLIHALVDRRVDGVILYPAEDNAPDEYLHEVWERDIPIVTVDRLMPYTHADFVGTDDRVGGSLAARHLLELGHRRMAHIAGARDTGVGQDRALGFQDELAQVEQTYCEVVGGEDFTSSYDVAYEILGRDQRPTALFLASDLMIPGVYQAARKLGLRIPDDVSVVGFADLPLAGQLEPQVTTVRQDPYRIGHRAAKLILERLDQAGGEEEEGDAEKRLIRMAPKLVKRASTGPAPAE